MIRPQKVAHAPLSLSRLFYEHLIAEPLEMPDVRADAGQDEHLNTRLAVLINPAPQIIRGSHHVA
jgi:hypothetical protein